MRIIKQYRLKKGIKLEFSVFGGGNTQRVSFTGGVRSPRLIGGSFITDDVKVQEFLENMEAFKRKEFVLEVENKVEDVKVEEKVIEPTTDTVTKSLVTDPNDYNLEDDLTHIKGISTFQPARTELKKRFPSMELLKSTAKLKAFCEEKKIVFDDWKEL